MCNITIKNREPEIKDKQNPALLVSFAHYGSHTKILRKAIFWCVHQTRREDENPYVEHKVIFHLRFFFDFRITHYYLSRASLYHGVQEAFASKKQLTLVLLGLLVA